MIHPDSTQGQERSTTARTRGTPRERAGTAA